MSIVYEPFVLSDHLCTFHLCSAICVHAIFVRAICLRLIFVCVNCLVVSCTITLPTHPRDPPVSSMGVAGSQLLKKCGVEGETMNSVMGWRFCVIDGRFRGFFVHSNLTAISYLPLQQVCKLGGKFIRV